MPLRMHTLRPGFLLWIRFGLLYSGIADAEYMEQWLRQFPGSALQQQVM